MNDKMLGLVQEVVRYLLESEADDFSTWLIGGNGGPKEGVDN